MFALRTFSWLGWALSQTCAVGLVVGQNAAPVAPPIGLAQAPPSVLARNSVSLDGFVDSAIRQEQRLTELMRNFKPVV